MIAFDVHLNGKRLYRAGIANHYMLNAVLSSVVGRDYEFMKLNVNATRRSRRVHVGWPASELQVGDTVTIKVLSTTRADAPTRRSPAQPLPEQRAEVQPNKRLQRTGASAKSASGASRRRGRKGARR